MNSPDSGWFERQYADPESDYSRIYKGVPRKETFEEYMYHVGRALSLVQLNLGSKVLDLGAGVGWNMIAFALRGLDPSGVEISPSAREAAHPKFQGSITVADVREHLPMLPSQYVPLVYSNALLEHIPEADLPDLIREMARVGECQAHVIAMDAGDDPSHITIKPALWWAELFHEVLGKGHACVVVADNLYPSLPVLYVFPTDRVPYPVHVAFAMTNKSNGGAK